MRNRESKNLFPFEEKEFTTLDALELEANEEPIPAHITMEELVREQEKDGFSRKAWESFEKKGEKVRFRDNQVTGILERIISGSTGSSQ